MTQNKGLGRGLDTLIPTDFDVSLLLESNERIQNVFVKDIKPNPGQPRRHFDTQTLKELAASVKQYGILQPLILTPTDTSEYKIIAGERRWRAAQQAGLKQVPAIVRKEKDLQQLEISLIENVQRVDLSPLEQAISIERLHQQFNMSYQDIADRLGKAAPTVNNIVRLLQLPKDARKALEANEISEGHARAVLALKGASAKQLELVDQIKKHGWSVRQAEQFVQAHKHGFEDKARVTAHLATETPETKQLTEVLSTLVTIHRTAKGGRLELHFKDDEELADLIARLRVL